MHLPYHDIEQMYRRVVLNCLAGVTDDHDRSITQILECVKC